MAIKTLPTHINNDPDRRTRFEREARVLASLNQSHIGASYEGRRRGGAVYGTDDRGGGVAYRKA